MEIIISISDKVKDKLIQDDDGKISFCQEFLEDSCRMLIDSIDMGADTYAPCFCHVENYEQELPVDNISLLNTPILQHTINFESLLVTRLVCTECGAVKDYTLDTFITEVEGHKIFMDTIQEDFENFDKDKKEQTNNVVNIPKNKNPRRKNETLAEVIKIHRD